MNKKLLFLLVLLLTAATGAWAQEPVDGTIAWSVGNEASATVSASIKDAISSTGVTTGSGLTVSTGQYFNTNMVKYQPATTNAGNVEGVMIEYTIEAVDGYKFKPTGVDYAAVKDGTDIASYSWSYTIDGVESAITDVSMNDVLRNTGSNSGTAQLMHSESITADGCSVFTLRFYISNCGTTKNICIANITISGSVSAAAASGYTVSLKDGVKDAGKWTVKAGTDGSFQSLPLKGVKAGTKVKLKYDGDRSMLKGVTATSDAKKEPATVTTAPTGAEIVGVGKTTALVSGGVADGGTLMYQMTTTNTKPTSTDGFSATVPTAQTITASGKVYVWYFVKADDTHSDSEIAGPVSVTLVEELTWNTTNVFNSSHQKDKLSFNKKTPLVYEGITISYSGDDPASHFYLYVAKGGKGRLQCYGQNGVKFTFTAPSGKKFVRIEMTDDVSVYSGDANWIEIEDENKLVWSGTPSNTVEIAGDDLTQLSTLNTIAFYLSE